MHLFPSIERVVDAFGTQRCIVTEKQSDDFWGVKSASDPAMVLKPHFLLGTLRSYLGEKSREYRAGRYWVYVYCQGYSAREQQKRHITAGRPQIDMGYIDTRLNDPILDMSGPGRYVLMCLTPTMLGCAFADMQSDKVLRAQRQSHMIPVEPHYFIEGLTIVRNMYPTLFPHSDPTPIPDETKKQKEERERWYHLARYIHLTFDRHDAPLRIGNMGHTATPTVCRLVGPNEADMLSVASRFDEKEREIQLAKLRKMQSELNFPQDNAGMCMRKIPPHIPFSRRVY